MNSRSMFFSAPTYLSMLMLKGRGNFSVFLAMGQFIFYMALNVNAWDYLVVCEA